MNSLPKITGNDIRRLRYFKRIKQTDAAALLGIAKSTYVRWERSPYLSTDQIKKILIAFETDVKEIESFLRIYRLV